MDGARCLTLCSADRGPPEPGDATEGYLGVKLGASMLSLGVAAAAVLLAGMDASVLFLGMNSGAVQLRPAGADAGAAWREG